ncbi:GNAT family N-acetyltransferase [Microvirga sp. 2TAF3]|uniref:GNAT family N-acetyltransferase n=1 Tax=Microvirga sp. 2TAF3 TaxID=3233014 RepID=UPI003F9C97B7
METSDLLRLYDAEMRGWTGRLSPGFRTERSGSVVRMVGPDREARSNAVLLAQLDDDSADAVIAGQVAFFQVLRRAFEWKYYSHDQPPDLPARLLAAGFIPQEAETFVALDVAQEFPATALASGITITPIDGAPSCRDIATVNGAVYGDPDQAKWLAEAIAGEKRADPDGISIYAAYAEDRPVSIGWMRHKRGDPFGGLFGGATLEGWRGKGIYSALVAARVQEARGRGCRFLTVDCSPMSLPILERRGFRALSVITPFIWSPEPTPAQA